MLITIPTSNVSSASKWHNRSCVTREQPGTILWFWCGGWVLWLLYSVLTNWQVKWNHQTLAERLQVMKNLDFEFSMIKWSSIDTKIQTQAIQSMSNMFVKSDVKNVHMWHNRSCVTRRVFATFSIQINSGPPPESLGIILKQMDLILMKNYPILEFLNFLRFLL